MKKPVTWIASAGIIAAIFIGVFAAFITYSSTPRFCGSCHIMETRYVSLRNSDHADEASCIDCHSEPGLMGEIEAHLAGSRYVYTYLTGELSAPILLAEVPTKRAYFKSDSNLLKETREAMDRSAGIFYLSSHSELLAFQINPRLEISILEIDFGTHYRSFGKTLRLQTTLLRLNTSF